jgi:S1-C subfamily serine protease
MESNSNPPMPATSESSPMPQTPIMELDAGELPLECAIVAQSQTRVGSEKRSSARPAAAARAAGTLWHWVLPITILMALFALSLYAATVVLNHWRILDAHAEAEATYLKRRAELKAEAEHADQRLDLLDQRVHLTSLGFREVARKVLPVVVNVANYREPTEKDLADAKAKRLTLVYDPQNDRKYVQYGVGSGLILKPGVILTNHHVIRKAQRLRVSFPSGRSIGIDPGAVVSDAKTDLAVIRLPEILPEAMKEETQNRAQFADSEKDVHVGDWVLAMGSPLGLQHTLTHGIISAKGRLLSTRAHEDDLIELLQTDAAINPGNSGGPLFDQLGRVVGINAMIASETGGNQGIGFAIPSNTATRIADLLLTKGEVPRGFLGITMEELPGPEAKALKIDDGAVIVKAVVAGQAADKAGIKPGDVIVRINKETLQRFKPMRHLRQIVADLDPGTEILIEIVRAEQRLQVALSLGKRPADLP